MTGILDSVQEFLALGGPVVAIILAMSVLARALVLIKLWQFQRAGLGAHGPILAALDQFDRGARTAALQQAAGACNHLAPLAVLALRAEGEGGAHHEARISPHPAQPRRTHDCADQYRVSDADLFSYRRQSCTASGC